MDRPLSARAGGAVAAAKMLLTEDLLHHTGIFDELTLGGMPSTQLSMLVDDAKLLQGSRVEGHWVVNQPELHLSVSDGTSGAQQVTLETKRVDTVSWGEVWTSLCKEGQCSRPTSLLDGRYLTTVHEDQHDDEGSLSVLFRDSGRCMGVMRSGVVDVVISSEDGSQSLIQLYTLNGGAAADDAATRFERVYAPPQLTTTDSISASLLMDHLARCGLCDLQDLAQGLPGAIATALEKAGPARARLVRYDATTGMIAAELVTTITVLAPGIPQLGSLFRAGHVVWEVVRTPDLCAIRKMGTGSAVMMNNIESGMLTPERWCWEWHASGCTEGCGDECRRKYDQIAVDLAGSVARDVQLSPESPCKCVARAVCVLSALRLLCYRKLRWAVTRIGVKELFGGMSGSKVIMAVGVDRITGEPDVPLVIKVDKSKELIGEYHRHIHILETSALKVNAPKRIEIQDGTAGSIGGAPLDETFGGMSIELCGARSRMVKYASNYDIETLRDLIKNDVMTAVGDMEKSSSLSGLTGIAAVQRLVMVVLMPASTGSESGRNVTMSEVVAEVEKHIDKRILKPSQDSLNPACLSRREALSAMHERGHDLGSSAARLVDALRKVAGEGPLSSVQIPIGTAHGDLNGRNVLIDSVGAIWVIDFAHTHGSHQVLQDLVKLEQCVVLEYCWGHGHCDSCAPEEYEPFRDLCLDLYGSPLIPETLLPASWARKAKWEASTRARKAVEFVKVLRQACVSFLKASGCKRDLNPLIYRLTMLPILAKTLSFQTFRPKNSELYELSCSAAAVLALMDALSGELDGSGPKASEVPMAQGEREGAGVTVDEMLRSLTRNNQDIRVSSEYLVDPISGDKLNYLSDCVQCRVKPLDGTRMYQRDSTPRFLLDSAIPMGERGGGVAHLMLVAGAAAGKTTVVKQLLLMSSMVSTLRPSPECPAVMAVYVPLAALATVHVRRLRLRKATDAVSDVKFWSLEEVVVSIVEMNGWDSHRSRLLNHMLGDEIPDLHARGVLVFDGLDELPTSLWEGMVSFLGEVAERTAGRSTFIISTRPSAKLRDASKLPPSIAKMDTFEPCHFGLTEVGLLTRTRLGSATAADQFVAALRVNSMALEMSSSPLLLTLLLHVYAANDKRLPNSRWRLYTESMAVMFNRVSQKGPLQDFTEERAGSSDSTGKTTVWKDIGDAISDLVLYLCLVAYRCQVIADSRDIPRSALGIDSLGADGDIVHASLKQREIDIDSRKRQFGVIEGLATSGQIPLLELSQGGEYQFSHLSWQEFLAARMIVDDLSACGSGAFRPFLMSHHHLTERGEVPLYIVSKIKEDQAAGIEPRGLGNNLSQRQQGLVSSLVTSLLLSRDKEWVGNGGGIGAANAITLLNACMVPLCGLDLSDLSIPGAHLVDANLFGSRLDNTDMSGANLTSAVLARASLRCCNVRGIRFGERPLVRFGARVNAIDVLASSSHATGFDLMAVATDAGVFSVNSTREASLLGNGVNISHLRTSESGHVAWRPGPFIFAVVQHPGSQRKILVSEAHAEAITCLDISPDGSTIATGSADDTIALCSTMGYEEQRIINGCRQGISVTGIKFSPCGTRLVCGLETGLVRVFDVSSGGVCFECGGDVGSATTSVSFLGSGATIVAGSEDGSVRVWNLGGGDCVQIESHEEGVCFICVASGTLVTGGLEGRVLVYSIKESGPPALEHSINTGSSGRIIDGALSPNGYMLAVAGGGEKDIRLWYTSSGEKCGNLEGHSAESSSVAFLEGGEQVVSAGKDGSIRRWNVHDKSPFSIDQGHSGEVYGVRILGDGNSIVTAGRDQTIRIWDGATGKESRCLRMHEDVVSDLAVSNDGITMASSDEYEKILIWDTTTWEVRATLNAAVEGMESDDEDYYVNSVNAVAFSPHEHVLASCGVDKCVIIWDLSSYERLRTLEGHTESVNSLAFTPKGSTDALLFSGSSDFTVRVWNPSTGEALRTIALEGRVHSVAVSADGKLLACASWDRTVRVFDASSFTLRRAMDGHFEHANAVAFTRSLTEGRGSHYDVSALYSGASDRTVRFWRADESKESLRPSQGHHDYVTAVDVSPDGELVASASWDATVALWLTVNGRRHGVLRGHEGRVNAVTFFPSKEQPDRRLATGSDDSTVRVWCYDTMKVLRVIRASYDHAIMSVAVSAQNEILLCGHREIHIYNLPDTGEAETQVGEETRVAVCNGLEHTPSGCVISEDGAFLASAGNRDKTVCLWDFKPSSAAKRTPLLTYCGHVDRVQSVNYLSRTHLVSGSWDGTVRILEYAGGQALKCCGSANVGLGYVNSTSVSSDKKLVAAGIRSQDRGLVIVYGISAGSDGEFALQEVCAIREVSAPVTSVMFSPSLNGSGGYHISVGLKDGSVTWWQLMPTDSGPALVHMLLWRTGRNVLTCYDAEFDGSAGFSPEDVALLTQRGAIKGFCSTEAPT